MGIVNISSQTLIDKKEMTSRIWIQILDAYGQVDNQDNIILMEGPKAKEGEKEINQ
jgi:hypothetical protein